MRRSLLSKLNTPKPLRLALMLISMLILPSTAWGQNYIISIAGQEVNSTTENITGDNISGKVSFNVASGNNTLTLDGATINGPISYNGTDPLTITLSGTNTIKGSIYSVTSPQLHFTFDSGSKDALLEIDNSANSPESAISGFEDVSMDEDLGYDEKASYHYQSFALKDDKGTNNVSLVHISYHYGLKIYKGNTLQMSFSAYKTSFSYESAGIGEFTSGTMSFDPTSNTLTLDGVTITDGIILWDHTGFSETLKIALSGNSKITCSTAMETLGYGQSSTSYVRNPIISRAYLDYVKNNAWGTKARLQFTSADQDPRSLILTKNETDDCIQGFDFPDNTPVDGTVSHTKTTDNENGGHAYMLISSEFYNLWVNNIPVHGIEGYPRGYKDNVTEETDGKNQPKVTYNSTDKILILNGATINTENNYNAIESFIDDLTVHLIDINVIICNGSSKAFAYTGSKTSAMVTFTTDAASPGSLVGTVSSNNMYDPKIEPEYKNGLGYYTYNSEYSIKVTEYGLNINSQQLTSANIDTDGSIIGIVGITGTVKFTPAAVGTPATLTLNSATINGSIKSSLNDLTIEIAGSGNTLTAILYEGPSNGILLIKNAPSSSSAVNKLTLQNSTGAVISGFSTVTLDELFFSTPNYPSVTTSTNWTSSIDEAIITNEYGITIGDVSVTTTNKDDVLNDEGTVKFTPADNTATPATPATLTLNGAKITGTVFWTNSAPLTIAINGTNSITTTGAYAIEGNNQDNTTLTIAKVSETGKCKLILSGSTGGSISGFKKNSDSYAGSGLVYYEDQAEHTATILSTLSGSGTSTDPYLIETPEDLKDFSFFVNKQIITNKYIKIANNIDCKDLEGFESIGSSYPFMGTLSGYGNTISNLTINSGLGFFGHISGGIVNDLNFYKLSVKGNSYATGGIASELSAGGQIDNCTLTECTIACLDNQYSPEVGGIVARLSGSTSTISNCVVYKSTINASTTYTGGSGSIGYAGGIVASYSSGTITNCHVKDGSKIINVNADGGSTLKTGAIVGNLSNETTTSITSNFYYYDVTVETQLGNSDKETKLGYTPRGTSDNTEDPTGAMLYTKYVIIPISTDAGHVSIGRDYYYQVTSDDTNATYSVAPDVEVVISVENADVEGSYTLDGAKTIELKPKEGSTGLYTFDMPNADVTFTVQEAAAVSFSEEGQIYASYYNATKDVAVPMGMTAYLVTGVSEDGTKVIVSPVSYIKAGVAVIIEKNKITEVSKTTDFSGNILIYAENDVPATENTKLYVLYNNKYMKVTSGTKILSGHCYLDLSGVANARGFYEIGGDSEETTDIQKMASEKWTDDKWFDLQGRRLKKPTKAGLYLVNGKKIIVNNK